MATRILIADDNPLFRKVLRQLLEVAGQWEIIEAYDGQDAIVKSLETRPNIVVTDLAMPEMDGLTAARGISKALPEIPILMCTMHASPPLEIEAQKAGVRKLLSKADTQGLLPAIQELLATEPPAAQAIASLPAGLTVPEASTIPVPPPVQLADTPAAPGPAASLSEPEPESAA